jgi:hypothetical protein
MTAIPIRLVGRAVALMAAAFLTAACNDPIQMVTAQNTPTLVDDVDNFRYQAWGLDNVHDTLQWTWTNSGVTAVVTHNSFIPHGEALLTVRNPDGDVVYQAPLETPEGQATQFVTRPGRPGAWTIVLNLYGLDNARIDFSVQRANSAVPTPTAQAPAHS